MEVCLRAELTKSDIATAEGITVKAESPVLVLCRKLIQAGYDPATPLEAYRGNTLALRVESIGKAAGLRVTADITGCPVFRRMETVAAAPPVRSFCPRKRHGESCASYDFRPVEHQRLPRLRP